MPVITPNLLRDMCEHSKGRLLGMDVGTKTVGLALSDESHIIASPYLTLERKGGGKDVSALLGIVAKEKVIAVVIGLPVNMDGTEGEMCTFVREFGGKLLEFSQVPVCYWDERLSTAAVNRILLEADLSRKRRKEVVDKVAASYILQGVLDWLRKAPQVV